MLTNDGESISYYGIQNHSCLLLCISEPEKKKKKKKKVQREREPLEMRSPGRRRGGRARHNRPITRRTRMSPFNWNSPVRQRGRHTRAVSARPTAQGGISGIDPISLGTNGMTLAQSKSDAVYGGLYGILNDKSKPIRERVNKFTRKLSIRRVTDLDIYTFDMDSNCLHMGCGHGMPKETLFAYAEAQLKDGQKSLKCPHLKNPDESNELCKRPWPS